MSSTAAKSALVLELLLSAATGYPPSLKSLDFDVRALFDF